VLDDRRVTQIPCDLREFVLQPVVLRALPSAMTGGRLPVVTRRPGWLDAEKPRGVEVGRVFHGDEFNPTALRTFERHTGPSSYLAPVFVVAYPVQRGIQVALANSMALGARFGVHHVGIVS
jgi:hypothetical protein